MRVGPSLLGFCFVVVLAAINIISVETANSVQIFFTAAKLIALGIIILGGIIRLFMGKQPSPPPFQPTGLTCKYHAVII